MTQRQAAGMTRRILACAIDTMIPAVLGAAIASVWLRGCATISGRRLNR